MEPYFWHFYVSEGEWCELCKRMEIKKDKKRNKKHSRKFFLPYILWLIYCLRLYTVKTYLTGTDKLST